MRKGVWTLACIIVT